jgi:hypothetical protein
VQCPLGASRQLQRVAGWLTAAEARLQHAVLDLRATADDAARLPEQAAEAPGELIDAAARLLHSASQIAALSERVEDASNRLLAAATIGAVSFDLPGPTSRQAAAVSPLIPRTRKDVGRVHAIPIRRRQSRAVAVAEAVRRIFRGRAPPLAAISPL